MTDQRPPALTTAEWSEARRRVLLERGTKPTEPVAAAHAAAFAVSLAAGVVARYGIRLDAGQTLDLTVVAAAAANALGARWARARVRPMRRRPLRAAGR